MRVFFVCLLVASVVAEPPFFREFRINVNEDLAEPGVTKEEIGIKETTYPPAGFKPVIEFKLPETRNHEHLIKGYTGQQLPLLSYEAPEIIFRTQDQIKLPEVEYGFPVIEVNDEIRERKAHTKHIPVSKYGPPIEIEEEDNKHSSKKEEAHKIEFKNESDEKKNEEMNNKREHTEQQSEGHVEHKENGHNKQKMEGKEHKEIEKYVEKERENSNVKNKNHNHEEKEEGETSEHKRSENKKSKLTDQENHFKAENEEEAKEKSESRNSKLMFELEEHEVQRHNNEVYGVNPAPYVIVVQAPDYKNYPFARHIDLSDVGYSTYFQQRSLDSAPLPNYFQPKFQPAQYYLPNNEW